MTGQGGYPRVFPCLNIPEGVQGEAAPSPGFYYTRAAGLGSSLSRYAGCLWEMIRSSRSGWFERIRQSI